MSPAGKLAPASSTSTANFTCVSTGVNSNAELFRVSPSSTLATTAWVVSPELDTGGVTSRVSSGSAAPGARRPGWLHVTLGSASVQDHPSPSGATAVAVGIVATRLTGKVVVLLPTLVTVTSRMPGSAAANVRSPSLSVTLRSAPVATVTESESPLLAEMVSVGTSTVAYTPIAPS